MSNKICISPVKDNEKARRQTQLKQAKQAQKLKKIQVRKAIQRNRIDENTEKIARMYKDLFPQNDFSLIKKLQQFTRGLDNADLVIDTMINYGIAVYGQSRIGKTSLCQLLAGATVKGIVKQGFKMVELASSRFKNARIGNTPNSQTTIPNLFTFEFNSVKITIIDTPGYGDNTGLYKIISNAFFHYRLYSRVQNMKFVIVFEKKALTGTAEKFISTIRQFVSSFKDYDNVKRDIWESACFLFTKADNQDQQIQKVMDSLKYLMSSIKIQDPLQQKVVKQITAYMIQKAKIFTVQTPKQGQIIQTKFLLSDIDKKVTKWFSRQIIDDGYAKQVEMKKIAFNVGKQITIQLAKSEFAQKQLRQLIQYYNIRIASFLNTDQIELGLSFDSIVNQIVNDAMNDNPNSHNFLNYLNAFTNFFYKKFDSVFENQRQKKAQALFQVQIQQQKKETQKTEKQQKKTQKKGIYKKETQKKQTKDLDKTFYNKNNTISNYFLKLFKFLKKIQENRLKTSQSVSLTSLGMHPMQSLKELQKQLYQIIRQLHTISYKKKKYQSVIIKFGWVLHRLIQESKVLLLLLQIQIEPQHRVNIFSVSEKYKNMVISRYLYDFMNSRLIYHDEDKTFQFYDNLRREFVLNFQINERTIKKLHLNCQLVDFFALEENQTIQKQIQILVYYSNQLIFNYYEKELKPEEQQILQKVTNRLIVARTTTQRKINVPELINEKNKNIHYLRIISNNLASIYSIRKMFDHALDICKSINFVSSACRIYESQIKTNKKDMQLRIQYSDYLSQHARQIKAIQVLQDAFQVAQKIEDIQKISVQLLVVRNQLQNLQSSSSVYFDKLKDNQYHQQLNMYKSFHNLPIGK